MIVSFWEVLRYGGGKNKGNYVEIGNTKEKLETLKTAAEQAERALEDGAMTQDQYDALQREIMETETDLPYRTQSRVALTYILRRSNQIVRIRGLGSETCCSQRARRMRLLA